MTPLQKPLRKPPKLPQVTIFRHELGKENGLATSARPFSFVVYASDLDMVRLNEQRRSRQVCSESCEHQYQQSHTAPDTGVIRASDVNIGEEEIDSKHRPGELYSSGDGLRSSREHSLAPENRLSSASTSCARSPELNSRFPGFSAVRRSRSDRISANACSSLSAT